MEKLTALSQLDIAQHEWQLDVPGFGTAGQQRLKAATVLVSRIGGLGGAVAWDLAAAGVGRLILAHAGHPKPSDFNRQTLMRYDRQKQNRAEQAAVRLREFKPNLEIIPVAENISPANASELVAAADLVVDCAPLFEERLAMNDAVWEHSRAMVECAMYEMQGSVTLLVPGRTACLRCLVPAPPPHWRRRFPVFGSVASTIGSLAACEAIKYLSGVGTCLLGTQLQVDLRAMQFHKMAITPAPDCSCCGGQACA
ncbi:MAG: HesA/MoeB/ThiF family protein [Pirellulaceae bacterium]